MNKGQGRQYRQLTGQEREYQYNTLKRYRESDPPIIPSLQALARNAGVAVSTASMFVQGNSVNEDLRKYIITRTTKNLNPLPSDLQKLFDIWETL